MTGEGSDDRPAATAGGGGDAEATLAAAAAELDEVEAALGRLDDGSFDRCEVCGATIGVDHLRAHPLARRCPAHHPAAGPAS